MQTAVSTQGSTFPVFWMIEEGVFKVRSKSHPALAHTLRRDPAGALSCTCPATRKCWHVKLIEQTLCEETPKPMDLPKPVVDPDDDCGDLWADEPEAEPAPRPITFEGLDTAQNRMVF